jgi:hypothetical protein
MNDFGLALNGALLQAHFWIGIYCREPQFHIDSNAPDVILLRLSVGGLLGKLAIEYVPTVALWPR